jgi:hypothetical protein
MFLANIVERRAVRASAASDRKSKPINPSSFKKARFLGRFL